MTRAAHAILALVCVTCSSARKPDTPPPSRAPTPPSAELRPPEAIAAAFPERAARSRALFAEAARVMLHPRCANCHPDGDTPLQGDVARPHDPPVVRGPADRGVVGMECTGCHQDHNLELARVPGAPTWHLAPKVMAWVGKTPHGLCEQLKDPHRNGGRALAAVVDHSAHDALVGWGWAPGSGRAPAPGSQAVFGALMQAWVDTGAECPPEENAR
jgi:hypothetical protein